MEFFSTSSKNLVAAAQSAGVRGGSVAFEIVNCDGLPESGYMRAKVIQERTITGSGLRTRSCAPLSFRTSPRPSPSRWWVDGDVRVPEGHIQLIAAAGACPPKSLAWHRTLRWRTG